MMSMQISKAATVLSATQHGADVTFRGISTDTRTLAEGNLFVALKGPNFDGHRYLGQARERGAVAAISEAASDELPMLEVSDTRIALGRLAAHWRAQFDIPFVAVTGSNGKTTLREMIASILRGCGETLATRGNLNNDIGVPLTLFGLDAQHDYAVIELGANHPGEIAYLTDIVRPQVAVINNAGPAHLEGFGDLPGVATAKGELFDHAGPDTLCVINADDTYTGLWRGLAGSRPVIGFGLDNKADVSAHWQGDNHGSDVILHTPVGEAVVRLPLPGRHNVMNALAATATALALNIGLQEIATGLASVRPVGGRWLAGRGVGGIELIDDTYNANPGSLHAALDVLGNSGNETWLVLGDMGELGAGAAQLHRDMGAAAKRAGVARLFTLGPLAAQAAEGFGTGAERFDDISALNQRLAGDAHAALTVLVKGSRSMHMERVVQALRDDLPGGDV
jgi:UDP-N-acetylmuramoyl-tripeptide--D-alanyl-D-alanine ligase